MVCDATIVAEGEPLLREGRGVCCDTTRSGSTLDLCPAAKRDGIYSRSPISTNPAQK